MIKYWLIVWLIQNGEIVEIHEYRYKNAVSCYQAMDRQPVPKGMILQAQCEERLVQRAY
jgi:hypothetical protein